MRIRAAKITARWKSRKAGERALRYLFPATRVLAARSADIERLAMCAPTATREKLGWLAIRGLRGQTPCTPLQVLHCPGHVVKEKGPGSLG